MENGDTWNENPWRRKERCEHRKTGRMGWVVRIKGNMVEVRYHNSSSSEIVHYNLLRRTGIDGKAEG